MSIVSRRVGATIAFAGAVLLPLTLVQPAHAVDTTIELPEGVACPDFPLRIEITNNPHRVLREFEDANGNVVRTIEAGKGNDLVLTNVETGEFISLKANGSVSKTTVNADGSSTVENTGHFGIILFPTDVPLPGEVVPSSTLYTGRVVYTVDANGIFTMQRASGRSRDICAELR